MAMRYSTFLGLVFLAVCAAVQQKVVRIQLNMNSIDKASPPVQNVSVPGEANAFKVMMEAAKQHACYDFKYKSYTGLGAFITKICGVEQNHESKMYWMFYVNGKKAPVGVSSYIPKHNDTITWKYEKVSW